MASGSPAGSRNSSCLIGCLGLLTPRVIILIVWFASDYLGLAYETWLWPVLGFLFMPITTLGYAVADNELSGQPIAWWVVIVVVIALDLGLLGGGSWGFGKRGKG